MSLDELLVLFRKLCEARRFEEKAAELYSQGHILGFCHLYIGQEVVVIGVISTSSPSDSIITSYRDHVHMLALGVNPNVIMAELCGKSTGCSHGKGGSMHMYHKPGNFYGGNGIVGAQVSIGTGLGFAHKYRDDGGIAFVFYGDGAANQGQVFESFNLASLWKLPIVYVLENNRYGLGTSVDRAAAGPNKLLSRGDSFGIPTLTVDGMNLFDVIEKTRDAKNYVLTGNGPMILHVDTYRYRGHSMSDPGLYRAKSEVEDIKKTRDPISKIRDCLLIEHKVDPAVLEEMNADICNSMDAVAQFAINSPFPETVCLEMDVLS
jgi:pyruvate dehydrogenase E1 component alpha subunit